MNLATLEEHVWRVMGLHEAAARHDWRRQMIRDAINACLDELGAIAPYLHHLERQSSIAVVAGTSAYNLNDYCVRPLSFWTEDSSAHKVDMINLRRSTRNGMRNPNAVYGQFGPYQLVREPRTTSALLSGAAGAAAGISTTEGDETVTKSGGSAWTSSHVGLVFKANGEDEDYKISSINSANSIELDKKFRGRLTGMGVTGAAANLSQVSWAVSPAGLFRIKFLPAPTAAQTVYYSYLARPRRLIRDDDVPELQAEFHSALWKGALKKVGLSASDLVQYQGWLSEYEAAKQQLKDADGDESDSEDTPYVVGLERREQERRGLEPGVTFRED